MRALAADVDVMARLAELAAEGTLLFPRDVIAIFRCDPKTVGNWARAGLLGEFETTDSGQRRFRPAEILAILESGRSPRYLRRGGPTGQRPGALDRPAQLVQ
jgi:hypothetical protein